VYPIIRPITSKRFNRWLHYSVESDVALGEIKELHLNQRLKRLLVIGLMIGYTYLQIKHIVPFNLLYLVVLYLVGLFVIIIITHKIRIVAQHEHLHKQERHNNHG